MSVNLYNSERYCDHTVHDALIQIENEAKKGELYICSPYYSKERCREVLR